MALDPRISLGVQPMQMPDPLAQYGKIAAIQQAQNANALAQYQLASAQREEEKTNALSKAYQEAYNPKSGEIDVNKLRQSLATGGFGAQLPTVEKALGELETQKLTRQKTEGELVKQRMEQSRELLSTVRTPEDYIAWHEANHADPVLGKYLASRGITAEQSRAQIAQQLQQPGGFETLLRNSALGLEKSMKQHFVTQSLGGTNQVLSMPEYQVPGAPSKATVVPGSVGQVTMTPGEAASNAVARSRLAFDIGQAAPSAVEVKAAAQERGKASVEGGKTLTESQAKAANFAGRMNTAFGIIDSIESNPTALAKLVAGNSWTNLLAPEAAQQYRQAQENWVTANLRKESGAVIGKDEMDQEIRKYFPVAGDKPKNIEQKRQARLDAMAGMEAEATESGIKAVQKSRQALGDRYQRKPSGDGVDTSNPLLK